MKHFKFIFVFFLVATFLQSCDSSDDSVDPAEVEGESTGDYWPRAIGNVWNFEDTYYGNVTYNMVSTETIDGNTYYKFDDLFGGESWLRKSGDSYYTRSIATGLPIPGYDVSTTPIITKILKDSALVGEEWFSDVSYTITYTATDANFPDIPNIDFSATYAFKMIERDGVRTVEGVDYENVLNVELKLLVAGQVQSTVNYYFAKDIGIIEFVGDQSSGTLLDYTLN